MFRYKIELNLSSRNSFEDMVGIALFVFSLKATFALPQFYEASILPERRKTSTGSFGQSRGKTGYVELNALR